MSTRNSLIAKRLTKLARSLPSENLIFTAQTDDLKLKFFELRESAKEIAECLAYKFGRGSNPITVAWKNQSITDLEKDYYQAEIDLYFKQWGIISYSWNSYLKEYFSHIGISNEIELFQEILKDVYNSCFRAAKKGYVKKHQKREKAARVLWDVHSKTLLNEKLEILNQPKNLELLDQQYIIADQIHWDQVLEILRPECENCRTLKEKFNEFDELVKYKLLLEIKRLETDRKNGKSHSVKWDSGIRYNGSKGGWKQLYKIFEKYKFLFPNKQVFKEQLFHQCLQSV